MFFFYAKVNPQTDKQTNKQTNKHTKILFALYISIEYRRTSCELVWVSLIELVILFGGSEGKLWNVRESIFPIVEKYSLNIAATSVGRDSTLLSLLRVRVTSRSGIFLIIFHMAFDLFLEDMI